MAELKIAKTTIHDNEYYVIYPYGNINEPLLMLADWQLESLMKDIGFELKPIKNV